MNEYMSHDIASQVLQRATPHVVQMCKEGFNPAEYEYENVLETLESIHPGDARRKCAYAKAAMETAIDNAAAAKRTLYDIRRLMACDLSIAEDYEERKIEVLERKADDMERYVKAYWRVARGGVTYQTPDEMDTAVNSAFAVLPEE